MADEQIKLGLQIDLGVAGGDNAAQKVAALTEKIRGLEASAKTLRDFANSLIAVNEAASEGGKAAEGLKTQKRQAEALAPAIQGIKSALAGQKPEVLAALGLDEKSIDAGGKSVKAYQGLLEKIATARDKAIEGSASATGRALGLDDQRSQIVTAARAEQRIREQAAKEAVALDRATGVQRAQVTMANAQQQITAAKAAAVQVQAAEVSVARQATSLFGRDVSPVRRPGGMPTQAVQEVAAAAKSVATGGQDASSMRALEGLAKAANDAARGLEKVAAASQSSGGSRGGGSSVSPAQQLRQQIAAAPQEWAQAHKEMRVVDAKFNADYAERQKAVANGLNQVARGFSKVDEESSHAASGGMRNFQNQQESIIGSVRQFLGMAAGYQVLQAVGNEIGQVFTHLKGGIIEYNSMIEQATVGFTTLFQNQADQAMAAGDAVDASGKKVSGSMLDLSAKLDYVTMGYKDAKSAAEGMIGTIKDFANVTPFRFAELQDSTLRMRAFGFQMDEILKKDKNSADGFSGAIVDVGNAVSALGGGAEGFRRITYALGQMKQAGRVYQNDMMQLANAGIGGYKYIAQALMKEISTNADGTAKKMTGSQQVLYNKLQANAIETVRRLTTNGQISGEAAARAILEGLNRDFGGGMKRLSMTFAGAFSTVADMSQSLMATAFKPFYNDIRDITYSLSLFLQDPKVMARAEEFGKVIAAVSHELKGAIRTISQIVSASFNDLQNAMKSVSDQTNRVGDGFRMFLGGFANGIAVIGQLLRNDLVRALVYAGLVAKTVFAFAEKNPFLTEVMLVITALGLLKQAYDNNTLGFRDAFNQLADSLTPLINTIKNDLVPLAAELGTVFFQTIFAVILQGFRLISPILSAAATGLNAVLQVVKLFEVPLQALVTLLTIGFIGKWLLAEKTIKQVGDQAKVSMGPITALAEALTRIVAKFDQLVLQAKKVATMHGPYQEEMMPKTASQQFVSGMSNAGAGIGMGLMGVGMIAGIAGFNADITSVINNIGLLTFSMSQIANMVPPGTMQGIKDGVISLFSSIRSITATQLAEIAAGLTRLKTAIMDLAIVETVSASLKALPQQILNVIGGLFGIKMIGTEAAAVKTAIKTLIVDGFGALRSVLAEIAGPLAIVAGIFGVIGGIAGALKSSQASDMANTAAEHNIKNANGNALTAADIDKIQRVSDVYANLPKAGPNATSAENQSRANILKNFGLTEADVALYEKYADTVTSLTKEFTAQEKEQALINFRSEERQSYIDAHNIGVSNGNKLLAETNRNYQLLVNSQNQANSAQANFNHLLGLAKKELAGATTLVEQLAKGALEDILNPKSRVDPYSGLDTLGLTYEQVLATEQEMGFAQFTNAQGIVRNFDEYKDVLNSILPLSDKDMVNGQISLKAVNERLKIEQERRKEQELITKAAEAEYNIGLANLQQYDQSIDPLQRAVNLHKAQRQYTKDINDLKIEGLNLVVSEATSSDAWSAATAATQQRLQQYKQGQQLILDQMTAMFNKYNQDVADILADPRLSASQRKNAIVERTKQLNTDLEKNFGITQAMMQAKLTSLNAAMQSTIDALGNPSIPTITWGKNFVDAIDKGGYGALVTYLTKKAIEVASLQNKVFAAANGEQFVKQQVITNRSIAAKGFRDRLFTKKGKSSVDFNRYLTYIEGFEKIEDFKTLLTEFNRIDKALSAAGLAKGGFAQSGRPYLVGEQGPEIFMPRTSGMVINSNISSRLSSMLSGNGGGGSNVTININNPVVRNDADIRKLADQISRVQASQFRTQGGRLS
jgi:hypothetical protein